MFYQNILFVKKFDQLIC